MASCLPFVALFVIKTLEDPLKGVSPRTSAVPSNGAICCAKG